ncbi:eukaryotic translation initiation factor 4G isoform X2 [Momordica charantia]|uniref:Eukaryotic translation initiation factor 4G n=1 Tax=Momordica charantia TaxID=3673 RepID=A0A6J1DSK4_MOMCH|nr:eukaryotic translation initiation factor 4G isoform X2 [Momordica charantia]
MSFNQSRSDKNESFTQYRKSGRSTSFNQQRGSSGTHPKPGGAGGSAPSPSIASNRSFKKTNNAQVGQSRGGLPTVNSTDSSNAPNLRGVQNGDSAPIQSRVTKPTETPPTQRSTRDVPKAPTSQPSPLNSDPATPTTPAKSTGEQTKEFSFQFGSISPGFMNGMQLPVRTSSAPPNLDEQKRDQARHESFRPGPPMPIPLVPKPQTQRKDAGAGDQPNTGQQLQHKDAGIISQPNTGGDSHTVQKTKKDVHASPNPPTNQTQKPTTPMSGISMTLPYHQSQVPVPFGGPNQQMQSQGITPSSLHMSIPVPLQIGSSPQVQQQMFVPGLHPHPMQPQGIIHQGQNLGFATQIGSQLPPQLSNLGINVTSQYPQQQGGKFGGPRKSAVRITDPKTHEELIFDNKQTSAYTDTGSSGPRPQYNIPSQTQPLPFAPSHAMNYYPNSYNHNPLYFASPSSLPLPSGQTAPNSQPHRFNYPVSQGSQNVPYIDPSSIGPLHVKKPGGGPLHGISDPPNREHTRDSHSLQPPAPSGTVHVTIKMPTDPLSGKGSDSLPNRLSATEEGKSQKPLSSSVELIPPSSQRALDMSSESSLHDSKVGREPLLMKSSPIVSKQFSEAPPAVSLDVQDSSSVQSSLAASSEETESVGTHNEGRRENLSRSDSQKKTGKKGYTQSQHQISGQATSTLGLPGQEQDVTSHSIVSEGVEAKTSITPVVVEGMSGSVSAVTSDSLESKDAILASVHSSSENSGLGNVENSDLISDNKQDYSSKEKHSEPVPATYSELPIDVKNFENLSEHDVAKPVEIAEETEKESIVSSTTVSNEVSTSETAQRAVDEPVSCHAGVDVSASVSSSSTVSENSQGDKSMVDSSGRDDNVSSNEVVLKKGVRSDQPSESAQNPALSEGKHDGDVLDAVGSGGNISHTVSGTKDRSVVETSRVKSTTGKGKKKLKAILQLADAAGTTSDLYMAYKRPEEKKETVMHPESIENRESRSSSVDTEQSIEASKEDADVQFKAEPDDWEDAADIATPKLETAHGDSVDASMLNDGDRIGDMAKKYSRDFLLKFAEQFMDLPHNFEVTSEIESLMSSHANASHHPDRDSYPSPGRVDRPSSGGSRLDRRGSNLIDDDRWSKHPGAFASGQDPRLDLAYGTTGFRPGQGANFGVLRNPRAQTPVQYAGGILAGPMQSMGSQGGMQRGSSDADRWQRATNFQQKGLIPSPLTPLQTMHRAKKKYEVGKVSDEEDAKQRQLKAILNKLTPQNFEKLFEQVKAVNIDNGKTLSGVISQIFDKALMEPTFCEMYANFCFHLAGELPDLSEDNEKITFKRLLLNKCQEEFERGEREQEEANKVEEEGEVKQSEEEREEKRIKARRRMLGNIRLIGELYKKKMLTERIMHECIKKLLGEYQNPDEEDVESLCKLMSTIGEMIDHPRAKDYMDSYFEIMTMLSNNMKLSSRVRFMLKDAIDLRKNKWQQRRKVEGPKKIEEVHRDAAQERQAQTGRFGRGPSINPSARRGGPPMDYGPRGSALSSPNTQLGGFRGFPHQARGYGSSQDARQEERQSYETRTLSVTLPQRASGDDSITLGPQGGLARGMSIRGPQPSSAAPADISLLPGELRSAPTASLNGYSSPAERATLTSKEDLIPRHMPERFAGPTSFDHTSGQDRYSNYGNKDLRHSGRSFDRSRPISPATPSPTSSPSLSSEKVLLSEEKLEGLSLTAIKEFYSARDEKEVALCIKDLNSPSFHPNMINLWVTDAFERTDMERDLLAKLLVNLSRSNDGAVNQTHLVKGFEAVINALEDTVNDAPRAPEYLGRILAKIIAESLVSLREVGDLIYQGGEEPGALRQAGLAADVLGNILKAIRSEKGEGFLNEMRTNSNLRLETFRPPDPMKSRVLEDFI